MDFTSIEVEKIKISVPESEVEEALNRVAASQKQTKPLEKKRKAESGDVLVMDFAGTVHGEALPGMSAEDHHLELGSNSFIQGFEEQLIGVDVGETREVNVTFPEEYVNDKLAGQPAVFSCTIKDILESVAMPVSDELAQALGEESLDTLKDRIREQIGSEYNAVSRNRMKRQILDKLAEGHDFPVPEGMCDMEFDAIWKRVEEDREKGELDPEDEGKSDEELKTEYRAIAERRVRLGLLLSDVGRINTIDVSQDELNQALMQEARRYPGQEQQVFQFYQSNQEAMAQLRAPLFEDKVIDYIADLAKVSERDLTPEELLKEEGAGEDDGAEEKAEAKKKKPAKKKAAAKKTAKKPAAKKAKDDVKEKAKTGEEE